MPAYMDHREAGWLLFNNLASGDKLPGFKICFCLLLTDDQRLILLCLSFLICCLCQFRLLQQRTVDQVAYKEQTFLSHSPGGWKSEGTISAWLVCSKRSCRSQAATLSFLLPGWGAERGRKHALSRLLWGHKCHSSCEGPIFLISSRSASLPEDLSSWHRLANSEGHIRVVTPV